MKHILNTLLRDAATRKINKYGSHHREQRASQKHRPYRLLSTFIPPSPIYCLVACRRLCDIRSIIYLLIVGPDHGWRRLRCILYDTCQIYCWTLVYEEIGTAGYFSYWFCEEKKRKEEENWLAINYCYEFWLRGRDIFFFREDTFGIGGIQRMFYENFVIDYVGNTWEYYVVTVHRIPFFGINTLSFNGKKIKNSLNFIQRLKPVFSRT